MTRTMTRWIFLLFGFLGLACIVFISRILTHHDGDHCDQFYHIQSHFFGTHKAEQNGNIKEVDNCLITKTKSCYNIQKPQQKVTPNSTWSEFLIGAENGKQSTLLVYAAYYDDRTTGRNLPKIRLLVTSSEQALKLTMQCQLWFPDHRSPFLSKVTIESLDESPSEHPQYLLSCPVYSSDPKPSHVSLTSSKKCANATNIMKLEVPIRQEPEHEVGLCVLEGHHLDVREHPYWLVEWVELNRLLGVKHVTFYNTSLLPQGVHGVIEGYVLSGAASLRHITIPKILTNSMGQEGSGFTLRQIILNDCLLRNLYHYKYTIVSGYNDVIIPQSGHNYIDITEQYFQSKITPLLSFDKLYYAVSKRDEDNLKNGLWLEEKISFSPKNSEDSSKTLLIDLDTCMYVKGNGCTMDRGEMGRKGKKMMRKVNSGLYVLPSVANVHSFFMKCTGDWNPKCVDMDKVKGIGQGQGLDSPPTAPSFNQLIENLKIRVKSVHDILRLDYDW